MNSTQPGGTYSRQKRAGRLVIAWLLLALMVSCGAKPETPQLSSLAETGIAGTQQARRLASLVAGTLSARQATPAPSPTPAPSLTATQAPGALPPGPESACPPAQPGSLLFIYPQVGWCFLYPEDFTPRQPGPDMVDFVGPAFESGGETVRAYVSIQRKEPVNGRTLDELMLNAWSESRNPFRSRNIVLGGRDALAAEGLLFGEADFQVSQVLFVQDQQVYVIAFSPMDDREPYLRVRPYLQDFWDTALTSFLFYR